MKIQIPQSFVTKNVRFVTAPVGKKTGNNGSRGISKAISGPAFTETSLETRVKVLIQDQPSADQWIRALANELAGWQVKTIATSGRDLVSATTPEGPRIFLRRQAVPGPFSHDGRLEDSLQAWYREQGGALYTLLKSLSVDAIELTGENLSAEAWQGLFLGMELASYIFKAEAFEKKTESGGAAVWKPSIQVTARGRGALKADRLKEILESASRLGVATNFSRHLVNLPPNVVNPSTLSAAVKTLFKGRQGLELEIWNEERLKSEGMGLHLGVGAGSATPPCLVHLRYRPAASKSAKGKKTGPRPVALVGKGVTFDSGGLDLKPSSGMRLMKKDMGGAASVLALALWASESRYPAPLDFYLGLAENMVDGKSFRPSDVLIARNGKSVEIHNTDAEGRLVLADVLDVAVTQKGENEPEAVINLATLTGAIKVALGADIAGLFSNDDRLSAALEKAGTASGELNWRMPLLNRYAAGFSSPFADLVNAVDGFGGAITAALFLERFVRNKPWAHLDIYAWNDKTTGSLTFSGGNGQGVQTVVAYLQSRIKKSR